MVPICGKSFECSGSLSFTTPKKKRNLRYDSPDEQNAAAEGEKSRCPWEFTCADSLFYFF
jgi:hypothetical protein